MRDQLCTCISLLLFLYSQYCTPLHDRLMCNLRKQHAYYWYSQPNRRRSGGDASAACLKEVGSECGTERRSTSTMSSPIEQRALFASHHRTTVSLSKARSVSVALWAPKRSVSARIHRVLLSPQNLGKLQCLQDRIGVRKTTHNYDIHYEGWRYLNTLAAQSNLCAKIIEAHPGAE